LLMVLNVLSARTALTQSLSVELLMLLCRLGFEVLQCI